MREDYTAAELAPHLNTGRTSDRFHCPFCDTTGKEHRDNFVLLDHGYHCHRCGESGSFNKLAEHLRLPPKRARPVRSERDFQIELKKRLGPDAFDVLREFGVSVQPREGIGRLLSYKVEERTRFRIVGAPPSYKGPKTFWDNQRDLPAGSIYGIEHCRGQRVAYLVGGEMDVWAAGASGHIRAFTFTKGERFIPGPEEIARIAQAGITELRVLYDGDSAGLQGSLEVAAALQSGLDKDRTKVNLLQWPTSKPHGYDLADLCADQQFNRQRVEQQLDDLYQAAVPPLPPGGFWWPPNGTPFRYPHGYVLGPHGTYQVKRSKNGAHSLTKVAPIPLWVEERFSPVDGGDHAVALCGRVADRNIKQVVAQSMVSATTNIPSLADIGFIGLTSTNARDVVRYVAEAQTENLHTTPTVETVRRMGWRGATADPGGNVGFVQGTTILRPDGNHETVQATVGSGEIARIMERYKPQGTFDEEAKLLETLHRYPIPMTLYLASLASALNEPLDAPIGLWQVADESSTGKTISLQIAQSCWGSAARTDLLSMNSTGVAIEVLLDAFNSLPLCLDELKSFGRGQVVDHEITKLVYMVSEGTGRARSNRSITLRETPSWSCNVLLTGEHRIDQVGEDTGIRARALSFWGNPFGEATASTAAVVKELGEIITDHHGNVGRKFIEAVMQSNTEELKKAYDVARREFASRAPTAQANFSDRWAQHYATLAVAGQILEDLEGSPLPTGATKEVLMATWKQLHSHLSSHTSYAERSMDAVREFVARHWADMQGIPASPDLPSRRETVGRVHENGEISLLPGRLEDYLEGRGISLDKALHHWRDEEWIKLDSEGNAKPSVRINGNNNRVVVLLPGVVDIPEEDSD